MTGKPNNAIDLGLITYWSINMFDGLGVMIVRFGANRNSHYLLLKSLDDMRQMANIVWN